jgi:hypothetical protein
MGRKSWKKHKKGRKEGGSKAPGLPSGNLIDPFCCLIILLIKFYSILNGTKATIPHVKARARPLHMRKRVEMPLI